MATVTSFDLDGTQAGNNEAVSYTEGDPARRLAPNATVSASGNFNGQTLTLSGLLSEDHIGFASGVTIVGSSIRIGGTTIGTFTGGGGGASLVIAFNSSASASRVQTLIRNLTYVDSSDTPTPNHTLAFDLAGTKRSDAVTVVSVNDAPVVDLNGAGPGTPALIAYKENDAPKLIAPAAFVSDVDSADFSGGALRVSFTAFGTSSDQLSIKTDAVVTLAAGVVGVNGIAIGTVSGGANGSDLLINFNNAATSALVTILIEHVAYSNSSEDPSILPRVVRFEVNDGDGAANGGDPLGVAFATIAVAPVNDAPTLDLNGSGDGTSAMLLYGPGQALTSIAPSGTIADADSADFNNGSLRIALAGGTAGETVAIITDAAVTLVGNKVKIDGTTIGTVSGGANGADLVVTFNSQATQARVQSLLEHIGYSNSSVDPSLASRTVTFTIKDGDGTALGGQDTATAIATINFNDAPTTDDVLINTNQDAAIVGKLGAADVDSGDTLVFSVEAGPQHGTLDLNPDGSYTYTPEAGYAGDDNFTFKVTDAGGLFATGMAAVTVAAAAPADVRPLPTSDEPVNVNSRAGIDVSEVTALADGGHLVVWSSYFQSPDSDGNGVFAQRYDAQGQKVGSEFLVNTTTSSDQYQPSAAGLEAGGFVVAWTSYSTNPDLPGYHVFAQLFDADGNAVGGEFLLGQDVLSEQTEPTLAALADGTFVATWGGYSPVSGTLDIYARVFGQDASGIIPLTDEFVVNTNTDGNQYTMGWAAETVEGLAGGRFVVVWSDESAQDGSEWGVFARVFDTDGNEVTDQIQVNTAIGGSQLQASVGALNDGGFVVTWFATDGSGNGIFAQRFDVDGSPIAGEFAVNTWNIADQSAPKVTGLSDGGFVIAWMSFGAQGSLGYEISGQRYDYAGDAVGGEFTVNASNFGDEQYPSLALRADGALVATWIDYITQKIEQKIVDDFTTEVRPLGDVPVDEAVNTNSGSGVWESEVAALADGGHLVVWNTYNQSPDGDANGIFAQRYDSAGQKVGSEFLVNTHTVSDQYAPSATGLPGGGFVVTWQSYFQSPDDSGSGIFAQLFDADGNRIGGEFLVNEETLDYQLESSVSALAGGNFVVTWFGYNTTDGSRDIYARLFASDGTGATALTGEFVVNTDTGGDQYLQTVDVLVSGGFIVVWTDATGLDGSGSGVFARIFEADGTPVAAQFQVNTTTDGDQYIASVGALAEGGFVVSWGAADGSGNGIFAQRFDADGSAVGGEFAVNTWTPNEQFVPKVSGLSDGGFVIAWESYGAQGNYYEISGQRYGAAGNAIGGEFTINASTIGYNTSPSLALRADGALVATWTNSNTGKIEQKIIDDFSTDVRPLPNLSPDEAVNATSGQGIDVPEVTALADGGHLVVWSAYNQSPDSDGWGVFGQRYDAQGQKQGTEFVVNATTASDQIHPSTAGLPDGGFIVTWSSFAQSPDDSGEGIFAQRFDSSGNPVGGEFLVNQETVNGQSGATVSVLQDGNVVVTWAGYDPDSGGLDVYSRVLTPDGSGVSPITDEFVVSTNSDGDQETKGFIAETVEGLADGRFVVVWTDNFQDGSEQGIFARVFEAHGAAVNTDQIAVNTTTAGTQYYASVGALDDGGFVVAWAAHDGISNNDIFAQRFDADGNPIGGEFAVNSWTINDQFSPKVSGLSDGGFVIAWMSAGSQGDGSHDINGQRYDSNGNAVGGEFTINGSNLGNEQYPSLALRGDGALVATWIDYNDQKIEQKIITNFEPSSAAKNLVGGPGNDSFLGSQAADTLNGAGGDDRLDGLGGNDTLGGQIGNDSLYGGGGDDTLLPGPGDDLVDGGSGSDTLSYPGTGASEGVTVDLRIAGPQDVGSGRGIETLISIENISGGPGNDTLIGNGDANVLTGNAGDDTLIGNGGADVFFGGAGNDTIIIGSSTPLAFAAAASIQGVVVNGGGGNDTALLDLPYTAGAVTYIKPISNGVTITHDGVTDQYRFVENFTFLDGPTLTLAELVAGAPTDIALAGDTVPENSAAGALVGTLSTADSDVGQSHTYSIGGGSGEDLFEILNGNEIRVKAGAILNFEATDSYMLTITSTDDGTLPLSYTETFTISVMDVNEPSATLNLADLDGSNGFRIDGVSAYDRSGISVSGAGDVNGDGFDDLIVGAFYADPNGFSSGASYVVFGTNAGLAATFALSSLDGSNGFHIDGVAPYDWTGWSVSTAGDINGDGFDDLIVGAYRADSSGFYAGSSYVVFGTNAPFGEPLNLGNLDGSNGFRIDGVSAYDRSGVSVSAAGDVNGDGFDDLIVGASHADPNGSSSGSSYVVFGSNATFSATLNLADLDGSNGFRIDGVSAYDRSGISVSGAGDVNGDGFDDLIVGAFYADPNGFSSGASYVVFGTNAGLAATFALSSLDGSNGFHIDGVAPYDWTGWSVSTAGDINGDGFDDLIVGAYRADSSGFYAGSSYVVFGTNAPFGEPLNLGNLDGSNGFRIDGVSAYDRSGVSVSAAGDVNGDGFDDLIVGAAVAPNSSGSGFSYVVLGTDAAFGAIFDLSSLDGSNGFRIDGVAANDLSGISVSGAGDVNGDGFDDLIVGAVGADPSGEQSGSSYVIFGHATAAASDETVMGTAEAEALVGGNGNDTLIGNGGADSFQGGAGNDTILVGGVIPLNVNGGSGIDTVNVDATGGTLDLSGPASSRFTDIEKIDLTGSNANTLILDKDAVLHMAGVNGDAFDANTLLIKGDTTDKVQLLDDWSPAGVIFNPFGELGEFDAYTNGGATLLVDSEVDVTFLSPVEPILNLADLNGSNGVKINGEAPNDFAGWSVSAAGDVNGDGFGDVILGAFLADPHGSQSGATYVVFGKPSGFDAELDLAALDGSNGFQISGEGQASYDRSGMSVASAGDINGDGFDDIVIGAYGLDPNGLFSGASYVVFGMEAGFGAVLELTDLDGSNGFQINGEAFTDQSGRAVKSAGDVNGDGFADLIIASPGADPNGAYSGAAYVVFGGSSTFGPEFELSSLDGTNGFQINGEPATDTISDWSVSSAGDVNGDGFGDIIVGVFAASPNGSRSGSSYVVFGAPSGFSAEIELTSLNGSTGFQIDGAAFANYCGYSVASAGDVNGDGFDDLIIGAPGATPNGWRSGASYVLFGKASGFAADFDVSNLDGSNGFTINGAAAYDRSGHSVSSAGDVNGDGFADLLIGAYGADPNGSESGASYIVYGKAAPFDAVVEVTSLDGTNGFQIHGEAFGDFSGRSVSAAGDLNGDGFDDLIIGAPHADTDYAGASYVLFGADFSNTVTFAGTPGLDILIGTPSAETFVGGQGDDALTGNGGADAFRGGEGGDLITVGDLLFGMADGGGGNDKLVLAGLGASFDFTAFADNKTQSIEAIDFAGSGDNTLTLGLTDVLNMPDGRNLDFTAITTVPKSLVIEGDSGDVLQLAGDPRGTWIQMASDLTLDGSSPGTYDFWVFEAGGVDFAALGVHTSIDVVVV